MPRGPGIAYILDTTGARAFVVDEEHVDHVAGQIGSVASLQQVITTGGKVELDKPVGLRRAARACARGGRRARAERPASILFTGGTTGPPKASSFRTTTA